MQNQFDHKFKTDM